MGRGRVAGYSPLHFGIKDQIDEHQQIQLQDERSDSVTNFANLRTDWALVTRKRAGFEGLSCGESVAQDSSRKEQHPTKRSKEIMDRMLVVVFDNEVKAYEGRKALLQLDNEGSISVYAYAVLAKRADGTASVKQGDDSGPIGTLFGTSFGSLIGLLGGPVGFGDRCGRGHGR